MSRKNMTSHQSWLLMCLLVLLCAVNLFLIKQNLSLRKQLAAGARTLDLTTNVLKPGDVVSAVTATDLNDRMYQLEYNNDGRYRLLLFFSPNCQYCEQQSPLWRDLLDKVDTNRFIVVGVVSNKENRRLVSAHAGGSGYFQAKTPLPILLFDEKSLAAYKLTATPTTLLIADDGTVEHAWVGKWDESSTLEVAAALK